MGFNVKLPTAAFDALVDAVKELISLHPEFKLLPDREIERMAAYGNKVAPAILMARTALALSADLIAAKGTASGMLGTC